MLSRERGGEGEYKSRLQAELSRAEPSLAHRDIEIQLAALVVGFFVTILFWYLVFFRNGSASKEYKWENSVVSEFGKKAFGVNLVPLSLFFLS
jgi:hypothetical protein